MQRKQIFSTATGTRIILLEINLFIEPFLFFLNRYNNKTYRVDDIEWNKKPHDTFKKRDGTEISYTAYYQAVSTLF